jgi:ribosomal subunit interface protein
MEFVVRAHSVDLDEATRDYAEAKIGRVVTKMLRTTGARVDVEVTGQAGGAGQTRVKVHVVIPHATSETVHADGDDPRAAIDIAADKIGRALRRNKEKRRDRARATGPVRDPRTPANDDDIDDDDVDVDAETIPL